MTTLAPVLVGDLDGVADMVAVAVGDEDVGDALDDLRAAPSKAGLPVKNGSISTALSAKSRRKAEWPNQVIFMVSSVSRPRELGAAAESRVARMTGQRADWL